jgi:protocatechuate 3,4-dioxygenase beta subunit
MTLHSRHDTDSITRRSALVRLGGVLATAFGVAGWKLVSPHAASAEVVSCLLAPEQTEGPYYIANEKVRRDITERRPGTPLALRLKVVDASTCKPIKGAMVEVWHCDAGGLYSGFVNASAGGPPPSGGGGGGGSQPTDKRTFLRGGQRSDATGTATFKTIYPGWYRGRTVHIHVKVHLGGNVVHTGQLYFPDTLTDTVYAKAPYNKRPGRGTRNANDGIFGSGGASSTLRLTRGNSGYVGTITMGVHRS